MTERVRVRIQAAEMGFLTRVAVVLLRDKVRSSVSRGELEVELLLLCVERSHEVALAKGKMPPCHLLKGVFQARPAGRRLWGRPSSR